MCCAVDVIRVSTIKKSRGVSERSNFVIVNTPIRDVCSFSHVTNYRELVIGCLICHIMSCVGLIFLKFAVFIFTLFVDFDLFVFPSVVKFQCAVDDCDLDSIQELHVLCTLYTMYIHCSLYCLYS